MSSKCSGLVPLLRRGAEEETAIRQLIRSSGRVEHSVSPTWCLKIDDLESDVRCDSSEPLFCSEFVMHC